MILKIDLKKLIAEAREIAESLDEFADKLEKIEKGVEKSMSFVVDRKSDELEDPDEYLVHSNNGFPHFMEERTEDDLEESEDKK